MLQNLLIPPDKGSENEKARVRYFKNSINPPETARTVVVVWRGEAEWCLGRGGGGGEGSLSLRSGCDHLVVGG